MYKHNGKDCSRSPSSAMFAARTYRVSCVNTLTTGNSIHYCSDWYIHIQPHITSLLPLNMGLCTASPLLCECTGILLTQYSVTSDAGKRSHKMSLFHDRLGLLSCWKCIYVFHEKFALWIFVLGITDTLMTRVYCCVFAHSNTTLVCTYTSPRWLR
jgi:hypothetical protein